MRHIFLFGLMALTACSSGYTPPPPNTFLQNAKEEAATKQKEMLKEVNEISGYCAGKASTAHSHNYTLYGKCANGKILAVLRKYHWPDLDLWELKFNREYLSSEMLEQHKLTKAEFNAEFSQIEVEFQTAANARENARYQEEQIDELGAQQIINAPATSHFSPTITTNCNTYGSQATCTTY